MPSKSTKIRQVTKLAALGGAVSTLAFAGAPAQAAQETAGGLAAPPFTAKIAAVRAAVAARQLGAADLKSQSALPGEQYAQNNFNQWHNATAVLGVRG